MKIRETIVVEGKSDVARLKKLIEADIILTNGTHLSEQTIRQIKKAQEDHGVIIFTDPDHPGSYIRNKINERVKGCKNAFLSNHARTKDKVGVEHATDQQILDALSHLVTYEEKVNSITKEEFRDLKLSGNTNSSQRRDYLCEYYHLGYANAKTLYQRINHHQLTYQQIKDALKEGGYE